MRSGFDNATRSELLRGLRSRTSKCNDATAPGSRHYPFQDIPMPLHGHAGFVYLDFRWAAQ